MTLPLMLALLACAADPAATKLPGGATVSDSAEPQLCEDGSPVPYWYTDEDGDGYGDPQHAVRDCDHPDGTVQNAEDCDDGSADVSPLALETCNLIDDDCDGAVDNAEPEDALTWYVDADEDHYGDPDQPLYSCEWPEGTVAPGDDCDDTDPLIGPEHLWYPDRDGDGYGERDFFPTDLLTACDAPAGYAESHTDCNDLSAVINPGVEETCGDALDNNCDGEVDEGCS